MPQKANPVLAEAVLALARRNAGLVGSLHQAALHVHERDGTAWNLEWLTLPDMIRTTGAGLRHAGAMAQNLDVDPDRMAANLSPATLAEAAVYALAEHMPKPEAQALVKAASMTAATGDMFDLLAARTEAPVDWSALRNPANYLGAANHFIDVVLKEIKS
jgi:3-carboxy-cis,cis-muconate cycloisomerase